MTGAILQQQHNINNQIQSYNDHSFPKDQKRTTDLLNVPYHLKLDPELMELKFHQFWI